MSGDFGHMAGIYEQLFPARAAQLDFLVGARPHKASELLVDLACGSGTHLEALCDRGLEVFGLDLSAGMIQRFRERRPDLAERAFIGDMQVADRILGEVLAGPPGLIYCLGNSLALLPDVETAANTLLACRRLLHPDGALVLQLVNFDRILEQDVRHLPVLERVLEGGVAAHFERAFEPRGADRLRMRTKLTVGQQADENERDLLVLSRDRLAEMLFGAGFTDLEFFGDYDRSAWSSGSPATIVVAR